MPFLKLFNFEPTVVTERTFGSLSNLHIKKKKNLGRSKAVYGKKTHKFQKLFSVWIIQNQYSLVSIK